MYAALYRVMPGPWWVRVILFVVIIIGIVAALFTWVFPVVEALVFPADGNNVGTPDSP